MTAPASRVLLDDGGIRVTDVRCAGPRARSTEEVGAELHVVVPLEGVFVRVASGRETIADPAVALVFRPGERYSVDHPLEGGDRCLAIACDAAVLDDLGVRPAGLDPATPAATSVHLLARGLARAAAAGPLDPLAGLGAVATIVEGLVGERSARAPRASADPLVDRTRLAIAADLAEHLTLPELGRRVGSSPFELARRFRASTGMSIHGYRTQLRVRAALARIEAGERDLTSLALDLGFAHHSHLTNVVRRELGAPPSAFRTILQAGASATA